MSLFTRIRNAFNPRRLDRDLDDEIRHHLESRAADFERQGIDPVEARRRAAQFFGNAARIREDSRENRLWPALEASFQDARYAWRGILHSRVFSLTVVLSLSVAIGTNTAIYSIVDAFLLRPLPVPEPDRLITLSTPEGDLSGTFSYPLYAALRAAAGDQAGLALYDSPNRVEAETGAGSPREDVVRQTVSGNAFEVLNVSPAAGRLLSASDDAPSALPAAVLSYDYWQRRFGGSTSVLGSTLKVNGTAFAIAGVVREGFAGVERGKFVDVWVPISAGDPGILRDAEFRPFRILGRLAPRVRRERLAARLQPAMRVPVQVESGASGISSLRRAFARPLWILSGLAACILLIACANAATLLLARAIARSGEIALRVSLGAGRVRLMRQFLTESLLLSLLAGAGGWLIARVVAPLIPRLVSDAADPIRLDLTVDARVTLFCLAICAVSAILFGGLPAWLAGRADPIVGLRTRGRLGVGRLFVGVQVAFAFALLVGGTGFLFSLRNLSAVHTGFDPRHVTVLSVANDLGPADRVRQLAMTWQLQARAAALPNVEGAASAWMPMFTGARRSERVVLPGRPPSPREEIFYRVSPGYFATLRTPLLAGRDFHPRDNDDEPVSTIVNTAFAARYFGSESAVGREFHRTDGVRHRIVGLVGESHYSGLRGGPEPIAYMPMKPPRAFTLYVRSSLDPGASRAW